MSRERADRLLVRRGLAPSREQAQALIAGGHVLVNGHRVSKASQLLAPDSELSLEASGPQRVSRAGEKLDHALSHFELNPRGCVGLDIGASTGGFTEVLLRKGRRGFMLWTSGTTSLRRSCGGSARDLPGGGQCAPSDIRGNS
ncbi:S4 domain-containing protein [Fodinicurvata halophila]|uniref:S4 domain-containing protein n=1 Tax=Fodinicurvata halophila TaxID=1419723 RepID=UPI0036263D16